MPIVRRLQFIVDLEEISDFIAKQSSSAALRFIDRVEETLNFLERFPRSGRACRFQNPALAEVRKHVVFQFKSYVLYYLPTSDGIEVLRAIHGARDRESILGEDFE